MKTMLVTGGAGFIGSHFIVYLLNRNPGMRVINLDALTYAGNPENLREVWDHPNYRFVHGNICDMARVEQLFIETEIDYVLNFAAESHVDRSICDPRVFVDTNVVGTVNLLNAARVHWDKDGRFPEGKKFLQISTDEVYGSLGETGSFTEDTPLDPHSPYSASKAGADLLVKAYYDTYGLPVNITRCSNNYGPCQFPEKLIPLLIRNAVAKKGLPIYGDGMNIRDWIYVEDHCKAIELVLHRGRLGEVYNVGGCCERTTLQIVRTIIAYLHDRVDPGITENLIRFVEDRKGHDRRYAIDAGKIRRELGWVPETRFEEGIERTIQWYLEHRHRLDEVKA